MRTIPILIAGLLLQGATAYSQPDASAKPRTVSVQGVGAIEVDPDQIRLGIQVNARGESATSAMATTNARTREILSILKSLGVAETDIQTSRVTVTAILDYEKRQQPPPIVGYTGTNEFSVLFKGKRMEKAGEFLDKAVTAGASGFSGLTYESSRRRELEREALKRAALDARNRAQVLAEELGSSLGGVLSISESLASPQVGGRGAMTDMMVSSAPVMAGQLTILADVHIVFELR